MHTSSRGARYFNDSIATIPEAAVAALESFPVGKVIQIVGGYDKHLDMRPMCEALASRAKATLTIGTLGPAIAQLVRSARTQAAIRECGDLAAAMGAARELAGEGDIVLLSTGCASYDQFVNFEERGDRFTALARES